jgi:hypothetical protein
MVLVWVCTAVTCRGKIDLMLFVAMMNAFICCRDGSLQCVRDLMVLGMFRRGLDAEVVLHWMYFSNGA